MSTVLYDGWERAERLDAVVADYLQEVEAGRPPNREALLARHPDLAEDLQQFFADRDFMKSRANRLRFIVPESIGDYELLEVLGSGTFGVVVKARNVTFDNLVALKLLRGEQWSSPEYVQQFRTEAKMQRKLDHPYIVPVHNMGEHEGQHYYEMRLVEGGSLTQHLQRYTASERSTRQHQRWAAALMVKIAQGVHYAHQHALIHRDLKPGNILLDGDGQPHITDFGLAKQLEEGQQLFELGAGLEGGTAFAHGRWEGGPEADTVMTGKGLIVGTAPYMSPQQAAGQDITTASDVYSLGVILYEMLTGQVPIRGATPQETMRLVRQQTPPPPRSVNPRIDYRLERICLKCLRKNPEQRYGSALGLARNLERWLADEALIDPPDPFPVRCWLWCRRNPVLAGFGLLAVALFLLVTVLAMVTAQARADRLEEKVGQSNAFAAQGVASMVQLHLERLREPVLEVAQDPELQGLLAAWNQLRRQAAAAVPEVNPDRTDPLMQDPGLEQSLVVRKRANKDRIHRCLNRVHDHYEDPAWGFILPGEKPLFEEWYFLDDLGWILGTSHRDPSPGRFNWRDYFVGAMSRQGKLGDESIHVSKVYLGTTSKLYKFGISTPVYPDGNRERGPVGIIVATVPMGPAWGKFAPSDPELTAVLVGPTDQADQQTGGDGPSPYQETKDYVVVLHPGYAERDAAIPVSNEQLRELGRTVPGNAFRFPYPGERFGSSQAIDRHYNDPLAAHNPDFAGRWIAGFAPVANTGYVVIVQQRYDDAIPSHNDILWGAAAVLLGLLFVAAIGWSVLQVTGHPR